MERAWKNDAYAIDFSSDKLCLFLSISVAFDPLIPPEFENSDMNMTWTKHFIILPKVEHSLEEKDPNQLKPSNWGENIIQREQNSNPIVLSRFPPSIASDYNPE